MSRQRRWLVAAIVGLLLVSVGCGSKQRPTYEAGGKVVFKKDGKPLMAGYVEFESLDAELKNRLNARGRIQPDGTFRLGTYEEGDGAVEGPHRVLVIPPLPEATAEEEQDAPRAKPTIHRRFYAYETSELQFTVTREKDKHYFVIEVE